MTDHKPQPQILLHQIATGERVPCELEADELAACCAYAFDKQNEWRDDAQEAGSVLLALQAAAKNAPNLAAVGYLMHTAEQHRRRAMSLLEMSGAGAAVLVEKQRRVLIELNFEP